MKDKVTLICNECCKKRKVSADGEFNDLCPNCGGVDWDVELDMGSKLSDIEALCQKR